MEGGLDGRGGDTGGPEAEPGRGNVVFDGNGSRKVLRVSEQAKLGPILFNVPFNQNKQKIFLILPINIPSL